MATQDEYLRNFVIIRTEHDLVVVSDPMQITIFNTIGDKFIRPNDLATMLNVPSSSLHFSLEKMMESGILTRSKSNEDRKSVYYSTNGQILFGTKSVDVPTSSVEAIYRSIPITELTPESLTRVMALYAYEVGTDMMPLMRCYAKDYARYTSDSLPKGNLEDVILDIRKKFAETCKGVNFSTFGFTPLTLVFSCENHQGHYIETYALIVSVWITMCTGKGYVVDQIEPISGNNSRIKVTFQRVVESPVIENTPETEIIPIKTEAMAIVLNGVVGIITSEVQIAILRTLLERPQCVSEIMSKTGIPRSTAVSNILRMLEDSVLNAYTNEAGVAYYGLNCQVILDRTELIQIENNHIANMIRKLDAEYKFAGGLSVAIIDIFESFGLDTTGLNISCGSRFARAHSDELTDFIAQMDLSSKMAAGMGMQLKMENTCPLTYSITPIKNEPAKFRAGFIIGFIHQCLINNSNSLYSRTITKVGNTYKVVFREVYPALKPSCPDYSDLNDPESTPDVDRKRSSSLDMALRKRSSKSKKSHTNTVRVLSVAIMLFALVALGAFVISPTSTTYDVDATSLNGLGVTDTDGNPINGYYTVTKGDSFDILCSEDLALGSIVDGIATPLKSDTAGRFTVCPESDMTIMPITCMKVPDLTGATFMFYNFDNTVLVTDIQALMFDGYIASDSNTGYIWVCDNVLIMVECEDNYLVKITGNDCDDVKAVKKTTFGKDEIHSITIIPDDGYKLIDGRYDTINERWCSGIYEM